MRGMRASALPRPGMPLSYSFHTCDSIVSPQILILAYLVASQGGLHLGHCAQVQVPSEEHHDRSNSRLFWLVLGYKLILPVL